MLSRTYLALISVHKTRNVDSLIDQGTRGAREHQTKTSDKRSSPGERVRAAGDGKGTSAQVAGVAAKSQLPARHGAARDAVIALVREPSTRQRPASRSTDGRAEPKRELAYVSRRRNRGSPSWPAEDPEPSS